MPPASPPTMSETTACQIEEADAAGGCPQVSQKARPLGAAGVESTKVEGWKGLGPNGDSHCALLDGG
jgi:hypothetical protein